MEAGGWYGGDTPHNTRSGADNITQQLYQLLYSCSWNIAPNQSSSLESDAMPRVCMEHTALVTCRGSGGDGGEAWLVATVAPVSWQSPVVSSGLPASNTTHTAPTL